MRVQQRALIEVVSQHAGSRLTLVRLVRTVGDHVATVMVSDILYMLPDSPGLVYCSNNKGEYSSFGNKTVAKKPL